MVSAFDNLIAALRMNHCDEFDCKILTSSLKKAKKNYTNFDLLKMGLAIIIYQQLKKKNANKKMCDNIENKVYNCRMNSINFSITLYLPHRKF